jgi:dTDP-glucose 4,6-dehydratase
MKYAVLASNSFTGSHFIDYILNNTDDTVIAISRSKEYPSILLPYRHLKTPPIHKFKFFQLDLNTHLSDVLSILDKEKPDYIVNYAAQGEVRNSWNWPDQWFETNTMSVVRLSNALVKRDYVKKYYTASTPEVYGATGDMISENHCYQPSTPYATSKLAGDLHLLTLFKHYGFPVVFSRAANLYGIHQQLYRIIPRTIIYLKQGKKIELHGRGLAVRSFIHARDVAVATNLIIQKGRDGEVYHLAPISESYSIADVVQMICKLMNYNFPDSVTLVDENYGQDALFSMSSEKIRTELGWQPQVPFESGVTEVIQWILSNWEVIKNLPLEYAHKA